MDRRSVAIRRPRHVSTISFPRQSQEHLNLFYSQLHGSLPRRNIREIRLQPNEFIILPDWNLVSFGCYTEPLKQILQQARTLQGMVKRLAQVFPKTQETTEYRFQIFDSTLTVPDIYLSTDQNEAKGQLMNIGLRLQKIISLPDELQTSNFLLSDVVNLLRQNSPDGWMLVLFVCTSLNVLDLPRQQRQLQEIQRQQAFYISSFSGFPLQEYFPHLSLRKQEPKIIQQAIRFLDQEPEEPHISSQDIPQGERLIAEFKGKRAVFDVFYKNPVNGTFQGNTVLYLNNNLIKRFKLSLPRAVEVLPLDIPGFSPFQFLFQPISAHKNGQLLPYHLTYRKIMPLFKIQKIYLRDQPWKIGGKDKFLEACRRTSRNVSFYQIQFTTPFQFSLLLIQDNESPKKTWVLTEENRLYDVRSISLQKKGFYASPYLFFLHDVMINTYSENIVIGINPVAVYVDWVKEKPQRIHPIQDVEGSLLPTEEQDWLFGRTDPKPQQQKKQLEKMLQTQQIQQDQRFHSLMSLFRRK